MGCSRVQSRLSAQRNTCGLFLSQCFLPRLLKHQIFVDSSPMYKSRLSLRLLNGCSRKIMFQWDISRLCQNLENQGKTCGREGSVSKGSHLFLVSAESMRHIIAQISTLRFLLAARKSKVSIFRHLGTTVHRYYCFPVNRSTWQPSRSQLSLIAK